MSNPFEFPHPELPDDRRLLETILGRSAAIAETDEILTPKIQRIEYSSEWLQCMLKIANNAWRATTKMTDAFSGEVKEEFKGIAKPIEGILRGLRELGFEIKDHTDAPYDEGQCLKVIVSEPTFGISKPKVKETYKPTVYFKSNILQHGEIVVAVPFTENSNTPQS